MDQDQINAAHRASSLRFHLELNKGEAWNKGQRVAAYVESVLSLVGYTGPVAVGGGCLRDLALGRIPKDLDIFLDGGCIRGTAQAVLFANELCVKIGHGAYVTKILKSYGTWAADVDFVVKVGFPIEEVTDGDDMLDFSGISLPYEIDMIVLRRDRMQAQGYQPAHMMSHGTRASFLSAVLARMDLRLNAIGACATSTDCSAYWNDDAAAERLVVQYARAGEDISRVAARFNRFSGPEGKYAGWAVMYEGPEGELHSEPVQGAAHDGQVHFD